MSLLSRLLSRSTPAAKLHAPTGSRLGVQQLEDRTTPTVSLDSAFTTGGRAHPNDVAVDAAGNSYLTGWFQGTTDFDLSDSADPADTLTANGTGDAFIAKYAADNSLIWVRRMARTPASNWHWMPLGMWPSPVASPNRPTSARPS